MRPLIGRMAAYSATLRARLGRADWLQWPSVPPDALRRQRCPRLRVVPGAAQVVALVVHEVARIGDVRGDELRVEESSDGAGGDRDFRADPRWLLQPRAGEQRL